MLYFLDLVGVFAFAFFGARAGMRQNFTLPGIITCAFLPALGGGTIREVLLNHYPVYFSNYTYSIVVLGAAAFALSTKHLPSVKRFMSIFDALGMVVFAYLGAHAAIQARLGIDSCIAFALLTACGGGVLCDLLTRQSPHAFQKRFYTLPSFLIAVGPWVMSSVMAPPLYSILLLIGGAWSLQLLILYPTILPLPFHALARRVTQRVKSIHTLVIEYRRG